MSDILLNSGAVESGRKHKCSLKQSLDAKPFSEGYWLWRHLSQIDAVRQCGYPMLFIKFHYISGLFQRCVILTFHCNRQFKLIYFNFLSYLCPILHTFFFLIKYLLNQILLYIRFNGSWRNNAWHLAIYKIWLLIWQYT